MAIDRTAAPSVDARAVLAGHRPRVATRARDNSTRWLCDECGQAWNVDGCDAVLLARRVVELEGALLVIIDHAGLLCCVHKMCASSGNAVGIAEHALRAPAMREGEGDDAAV